MPKSKPIGSLSPDGKYKKYAQNDWREVKHPIHSGIIDQRVDSIIARLSGSEHLMSPSVSKENIGYDKDVKGIIRKMIITKFIENKVALRRAFKATTFSKMDSLGAKYGKQWGLRSQYFDVHPNAVGGIMSDASKILVTDDLNSIKAKNKDAKVLKMEKRIQRLTGNEYELGAIYDIKGEVHAVDSQGVPDRIDWKVGSLSKVNSLTHNHPPNKDWNATNGLSRADIISSIAQGIGECRAIVSDSKWGAGAYVFKNKLIGRVSSSFDHHLLAEGINTLIMVRESELIEFYKYKIQESMGAGRRFEAIDYAKEANAITTMLALMESDSYKNGEYDLYFEKDNGEKVYFNIPKDFKTYQAEKFKKMMGLLGVNNINVIVE